MTGFVDLHCHWVPGIDDGARTLSEGLNMLQELANIGFSHVVATPHMRPGLFDNERERLVDAFQLALPVVRDRPELPQVSLGCEHFFDDIVFSRLKAGQALPYCPDALARGLRTQGAILIEFHDFPPLALLERQLFEMQTWGYIPVIAHPERYRTLWKSPEQLERLIDLGSVALLDVAALVGKYGGEPQRCAEQLLELGLYDAACSDAHRPSDVQQVAAGIDWIRRNLGVEEVDYLLRETPWRLLHGERPN